MSKTLKQDSTRVSFLVVFYKNNKALIFELLGVVVYLFIEKYVCVDSLCLQIGAK